MKKVFAGLCVLFVIELRFGYEFSGSGFMGSGRGRLSPVEDAPYRFLSVTACFLCGEFRVFGVIVLRIMWGRGWVVGFCLSGVW